MSLMKNNIKLFFQTLLSNNAAIDAGRKKPWYAAIIIFFISLILSVIPTTVLKLKDYGDLNFNSTTYMANQAVTAFVKDLQEETYANEMYVVKQDKESFLIASSKIDFEYTFEQANVVTYKFIYKDDAELTYEYKESIAKDGISYFIFTQKRVYIKVAKANSPENVAFTPIDCINAYKKIGENDIKNSYIASSDYDESVNGTWSNWVGKKGLIRRFNNSTRLKVAGVQLGVISAVNVGIILIMSFMVWVLTRGKNNPYRIFTVWEAFKIVFWASLTPAILTAGLGFLIKTFASTIFPLLLGVRVMWLSMKSLRPDGSGYAASEK